MKQKMNLVGMKFNRWLVISVAPSDINNQSMFNCLCDCGNKAIVYGNQLKRGSSKSCGCLRNESIVARSLRHGYSRVGNVQPEYHIWLSMKERCNNPDCKAFKWYGGRGIKVCERWQLSFIDFINDVGLKPTPKHTLDRYPNKNGDYEPLNFRWATRKEQSRNIRTNRIFNINGKEMILADIAIMLNVKPQTLGKYITRNGIEKAMLHYAKR